MADLFSILHDNWTLLLIGQYPNGPLGGLAKPLVDRFLLSFGVRKSSPVMPIMNR